jgi:hypothetical protein
MTPAAAIPASAEHAGEPFSLIDKLGSYLPLSPVEVVFLATSMGRKGGSTAAAIASPISRALKTNPVLIFSRCLWIDRRRRWVIIARRAAWALARYLGAPITAPETGSTQTR